MRFNKHLSFILTLALVISSVFAPANFTFAAAGNAGEVRITILHTNDSHGRIDEDSFNKEAGMARIKTYFDEEKKENPNTILLDAGDTFHGKPISTISRGEVTALVMNEVGYSAMTAGNHDFNYGYDRLLELQKIAKFPIVCANVLNKDNKSDLPQTTIIEVGGIKVGVFGLATEETKVKSAPKNTEGLTFVDNVKASEQAVKELKDKGAQVIVLLAHLGVGTETEAKLRSTYIAENVKGIDLIIDGHSHTEYGEKVKDTYIAQTGAYIKNLGVVDITLKDGKVSDITCSLVKNEELLKVEQNKEILEIIKTYDKQYNAPLRDKVIGENKTLLDGKRELVRATETNLGNLLADAMKKIGKADVAITNGGGIRADIPVGTINMGHLLTSFPFTNIVTVIEVSGAELKSTIEYGTNKWPEPAGKFPHVSGITYTIDGSKDLKDRVYDIKVNGKDLELDKMYVLATNDFMADGGDGYTMLKGKKHIAYAGLLSEVLAQYFEETKVVEYKTDGRIKELNKPELKKEETTKPTEVNPTMVDGKKSEQKITLNGKAVNAGAYNFSDENYFKLRDMAALLKDTSAKFDVSFDEKANTVVVTPKSAYKPLDTDLKAVPDGKVSGFVSPHKVKLGEKLEDIKAYNVSGNNYFRLRDLGAKLNFSVDWEAATNTIIIKTAE